MNQGDIIINIRLHTDEKGTPTQADIIVNRNGLSKIGRVTEYTSGSDLNPEIDRLTSETHVSIDPLVMKSKPILKEDYITNEEAS